MVAGVSRIASGAVDADYAITYTAGTLTVTAAPLTITADSKSKVYGAALPALTVTYTGLVNADTPATFATAPNIAPAIATPATAASHAGSYPITASGAVDADYAITYIYRRNTEGDCRAFDHHRRQQDENLRRRLARTDSQL